MEKEVHVGQLIAGKYRIEHTLGRGGMGVVMAALHEQLNQRVALKFLTDNAYQQPEAVARFVREARAAVQIQSEHVARVMDVGTLDSGAPYMVMEYLRGRDLKEVSARRGPLPVSEAVDYLLQACDAVAEAHSLGIVHRDLKPSNLFLSERPDGSPLVKVLDFGISKALHAGERGSQMQMTASAAIMGSPQYMSPEQIRSSKSVDARADVWALGTILHELLTGSPAYVADTVPGLLAMIVADAPTPLSSVRPDAPLELEAAILRCLQKDREQRFASVAVLARALERFASSDAKPLVRRIARILGEDSAPETEVAPLAPAFTVNEPVGQTNGTWARTGRLRDAPTAPPLYARTGVQMAAGVGVLGLAALIWFLAAGPGAAADANGERQLDTTAAATRALSAPAPAPSAAASPAALPPPAALSPPAVPLATPTVATETVPAGIRPILEPVSAHPAAASGSKSARDAERASEAARQQERSQSSSAEKVARSPAPRPQRSAPSAPSKPARPPARSSAEPVLPSAPSAAPAAPKKKADALDEIFNDTK